MTYINSCLIGIMYHVTTFTAKIVKTVTINKLKQFRIAISMSTYTWRYFLPFFNKIFFLIFFILLHKV